MKCPGHIEALNTRRRKPVVCIETGEEYPSIYAAAKANYVNKKGMLRAVTQGRMANGRHFRLAEATDCNDPRGS